MLTSFPQIYLSILIPASFNPQKEILNYISRETHTNFFRSFLSYIIKAQIQTLENPNYFFGSSHFSLA
jgi:hypothetical protein